jgi:hypothetical protein
MVKGLNPRNDQDLGILLYGSGKYNLRSVIFRNLTVVKALFLEHGRFWAYIHKYCIGSQFLASTPSGCLGA